MSLSESLLRPPRGMRDLLPEDYYPMLYIFEKLSKVAESYGYLRVETPAVEHFEVLKAKAGEEVINEIYYFKDKAGRELGLRFDLTVPIARIVAYRKDLPKPIRWYYISKVWRYDEPQHGRYREFHQYGVEHIGTRSILADVEVLQLLVDSLLSTGLENFTIRINDRRVMDHILSSLGVPEGEFRVKVLRVLDKRGKVPDDELKRMLIDVGLDEPRAEKLVEIANISTPLDKVIDIFEELKIPQELVEQHCKLVSELKVSGYLTYMTYDFGIVRGLDYYTGLVFEVYVPDYRLAIGGGGRYDDLIKIYSGADIPALGFAVGIERLLEVLTLQGKLPKLKIGPDYYIYVIGEDVKLRELSYKIAKTLRARGHKVVQECGERSLRAALEYASKIGAKYFIIIAPREVSRGTVKIRDLERWEEREVKLSELLEGQTI